MKKVESIQVSSWMDLQQFGIQYLTGEACTYSLRILCDLSEEGCLLVCDYLGLPPDTKFAANWNSMVGSAPAVASVMLARDSVRQIAHFAFFRMGALAMLTKHGTYVGIFDADLLERYVKLIAENPDMGYDLYRNTRTGNPAEGSRNVHAMTGRTE